jgi:predicted SprT family Zn-dependent metalloprotease
MRLPKLPAKIIIMTREYRLRYNSNLECNGQCLRADALIEINPDAHHSLEQLQRTIWHEIFHCWCWEVGISSTKISHDMEEMIVETLSAVVVQLTNAKVRGKRK